MPPPPPPPSQLRRASAVAGASWDRTSTALCGQCAPLELHHLHTVYEQPCMSSFDPPPDEQSASLPSTQHKAQDGQRRLVCQGMNHDSCDTSKRLPCMQKSHTPGISSTYCRACTPKTPIRIPTEGLPWTAPCLAMPCCGCSAWLVPTSAHGPAGEAKVGTQSSSSFNGVLWASSLSVL